MSIQILQRGLIASGHIITGIIRKRHRDDVLSTVYEQLGVDAYKKFPGCNGKGATLDSEIVQVLLLAGGDIDTAKLWGELTPKALERLKQINTNNEPAEYTPERIQQWCRDVLDAYLMREMQDADAIANKALESGETVESVLSTKAATINALQMVDVLSPDDDPVVVANEFDDDILRMIGGDTSVASVPFCIPQLDRRTGGGMPRKAITILGGLQGGGKTILMQNIAYDTARRLKNKQKPDEKSGCVVVFEADMKAKDFHGREARRQSVVDVDPLKIYPHLPEDQRLPQDQLSRDVNALLTASNEIKQLPVVICPRKNITIAEMVTFCYRQIARYGFIELVCVDHIERYRPNQRLRSGEDNYVNELYYQLDAALAPFNCAALVLQHVNRDAWSGSNPTPRTKHLRYGGEGIAEIVLFTWLPHMFMDQLSHEAKLEIGLETVNEADEYASEDTKRRVKEISERNRRIATVFVTKVRDHESNYRVPLEQVEFWGKYADWRFKDA